MDLTKLPDSLLLEVFFYLGAKDLASLACTCSRFSYIVKDELLWKHVFRQRFKVPRLVPLRPGATSWRSEYQRLWEETPAVLCKELTKHRDQVLHVSFSHNGQLFSTCSKDGKVLVWNSDSPCTLRFCANMMDKFNWRYTQFSQFNKTDTLLLVSGVFHGNMTTSGEIAVFDLKDFEVQCRVVNKPYDVFGCWYNNQHLFSGTLYWTGHLQSISALWLNKASQEVESEKESVMMNLYRFSNVNASSIRTVMVADVPVLEKKTQEASVSSRKEATVGVGSSEATMEVGEDPCPLMSQNGDSVDEMGEAVVKNGQEENTNNNSCDVVLDDCNVDRMWEGDDEDLRMDCASESCATAGGLATTENFTSSGMFPQASSGSRRVPVKQTADVGAGCSGWDDKDGAGQSFTQNAHYSNGGNECFASSEQEYLPSSSSASASASPFMCCWSANDEVSASAAYTNGDSHSAAQRVCSGSHLKPNLFQTAQSKALDVNRGLFSESDSSSSPSVDVYSFPDSTPTTDTPSCEVNTPPQKHASDIPRMSNSSGLSASVRTEKLLIFTMGEETYTPHLIGFKRILRKDIVGEEEAERVLVEEEDEEGVLLPNVEHNVQGMNQPPTEVDHSLNLKGHIVGMALSPDHRYLYVNSRQWPQNYHIEAVLEPPPIAQEIDIHVIDLVTLTEVGTIMRSHKAFTPNDECFFLFLDVSEHFVASGAEDRRGYLWERHYGVHLQCFPHNDVVNSVAFNPRDQEMLITVSDDNTIKIWRSRRKMRMLQKQHT